MSMKRALQTGAVGMFLVIGLLPASVTHAEADSPPAVYLDGRALSFETPPMIENGFSLVPLRTIFEAEGAKVSWDETTRTVKAVKGDIVFTYQIGQMTATKNKETLDIPISGKIIAGNTMIPLRLISETLGNLVQWHNYDRSITISSARSYETTIEYGVNLRDAPNTGSQVLRMIPKKENIHVIREMDTNWLEVQTKDGAIGFLSADPQYSDYSNSALTEQKANDLLTLGYKFLGTPYAFGASSDQTKTFDCSSFVRYLFKEVLSIELPRVSYEQALEGKEVGLDDLRKGDLLFFSARGLDIGHVGIYAGDGKILHTYSKEEGVHVENFDDKWKKRFVTAKRLF